MCGGGTPIGWDGMGVVMNKARAAQHFPAFTPVLLLFC